MKTAKDYMTAANAVVERISTEDALTKHGAENTVFVDVRDSGDIAKTGTVALFVTCQVVPVLRVNLVLDTGNASPMAIANAAKDFPANFAMLLVAKGTAQAI